ncbi:MAG: hypothetical protein HQL54_10215 [Magnetococcales bacterium]|nr:hypothetical protein [Magnetococcales bacterium]
MAKVCSNEQEALIEIKSKILQIIQNDQLPNAKKMAKVLEMFDSLPRLRPENMVEIKCKTCTFPDCTTGQKLVKIKQGLEHAHTIEDVLGLLGHEHLYAF